MIKNYYWAMAVMAAFVAGTIATATPVFAPPPEDDGEGGWKAALDMLPKSTYTVTEQSVSHGMGTTADAIAACDEGDVLLSCGFEGLTPSARITQSIPDTVNQDCDVVELNVDATLSAVRAIALCADIDPPHVEDP